MDVIRSYESPTRVVHGLGAVGRLGEEARRVGVSRPLVVTDRGIVQAGILGEAMTPLREARLDPVVFERVKANPPAALVDEGADAYRKERCDGLVAIGGGSAIDTAKGIGVVAAHGGSILDYEYGAKPIERRIRPLIAVPTTAGTGSEVTLWAVITDPERRIKFNVGGTPNVAPWVALIDPSLTVNLPPEVTAGTGMDALAHAVECYTMQYAQPVTDAVALHAIDYISRYLRVAYEEPHNLEARYHMSVAAMLAGLAYGTESAGAAHAMSQSAGGVHDVPHGTLTGRLLGPVVEFNHVAAPERFAHVARAMGKNTRNLTPLAAAEVAVEEIYRLTDDLRIATLQDLGFRAPEIPYLATIAYEDPQTVGNPRPLDPQSYEQIWRSAFEA
ncbi:MAG: iron-containing alcohol dehydrogenase [Acidimicrobiales bacterium]